MLCRAVLCHAGRAVPCPAVLCCAIIAAIVMRAESSEVQVVHFFADTRSIALQWLVAFVRMGREMLIPFYDQILRVLFACSHDGVR